MAINLNPGADATLVGVAYRAAMADTPGDYSDTFEKAAESYGKTMEAQTKMWGNIGSLGGAIGSEMMANANELSAYVAKGSGLDSEGSQFLVDEIYANKEAQKDLGLFGGALGNRETRQKRQELKLKQKELFAEIDLAAESVRAGAEAVGAGLFDADLNETEADMVNAIIKSNLKDKVTENGNMAKLTRDEKTGELMYTMYKEGGEQTMINGEPVTMTMKEFKKAIANNTSDGGAMQKWSTTYNNSKFTNGTKSVDGVYDPQMKHMELNQLDEVIKSDNDLKRAFKTKVGYSNTSFFDDIQNPSTLSADLYSTLLTATGGGDALTGSITDNMVDTDGEAGISQAELTNATNYGVLSASILGMKDPEVSRAYFKEYASKKFQESFEYGYSKKPPKTYTGPRNSNSTDKTDKIDFYSKGNKVQLLNNQYLSGGSAQSLYSDIEDGNSFDAKDPLTGNINNYSYKVVGDEGGWYENYKEGDTPESNPYIGSGYDLSKIFTNDARYKSIQTTVEQEIDLKTGLTNFDNPFGDGTDKIATLPSNFIKAVGKDDLKVKEYLDNMKITGLKVKASGFGSDSVVLKLGGKSKVFVVDTSFTDDEDRASEIWKWLHANWSVGKSNYSGSAADIIAEVE